MTAATDANADIVLGPFAYERGETRIIERSLEKSTTSITVFTQWLVGEFTPPCSVLWRRAFVEHIGGWNIKAKRNQDGEMVLRGQHETESTVAHQ